MKIYWTIKSIPELKGLPPAEWRARWKAVVDRVRWTPVTWLAAIPCAVLAALVTLIGHHFGWGVLGSLVGGGLGGLAFSQILIAHSRRRYRAILLGQEASTRSSESVED